MVAVGRSPVVGSGLRSPVAFSAGRGVRSLTVADGLEKVQASIRTILTTRPGERVMQPEFGSRLFDLVFESDDPVTRQLLAFYTADALSRWERRIRVLAVNFADDSTLSNYIGINIEFEVLATHQRGSYVFPYEINPIPMSDATTGTEVRRILNRATVVA